MGLEDDGASDYVHRLRRFRGPYLDRLRASTNLEDLIWLDGMGCRENSVCPLSPGGLEDEDTSDYSLARTDLSVL